jgi:hypothetical protein
MKTYKEFIVENNEVATPNVFEVPVHNIDFLEGMLNKLNKTAQRLNADPITISKSKPFSKQVEPEKKLASGKIKPAVFMEFVKVTIVGEAPKLNGWSFVGKREPMEGGNSIIAKSAPGHELPATYQDDHDIKCDHCGHNRRRNESFVVKNESGKHMEVGRSCLKDFLGHADPEKYADFATALWDIKQVMSEIQDPEYGGGGRGVMAFSVREIVAASIHSIRDRGFVSNANATETKSSTSAGVNLHMYPPKKDAQDFIMPVSAKDYEDADKAIDWMKNHPKATKEEFWINISKLASGESAGLKYTGYIAAGANSYLKDVENLEAKKGMLSTVKTDEGLGEVGKKVTVKGEVISAFSYQNDWGTKHILTVKADSGHLIKMFTSSGDDGVKKGARVEITGKIGTVAPEEYATSPFKGMTITTMAPRSRIESIPDAEHFDKHFHVGDKIKFTGADGKGKIGEIVAKPVFGRFEVKSITQPNAPTIYVSHEDILSKM